MTNDDYDDETALAELLINNVCFINQRKYVEIDGTIATDITVIFVNCNDVFMWACAEGEALLNEDIKPLYFLWHANKYFGMVRWVCLKRQEKPQGPIVRDMKTAGLWDDVMEALPENAVDAYTKAQVKA